MSAGVAKTAFTAMRDFKFIDNIKLGLNNGNKDQLGDALPYFHSKGRASPIPAGDKTQPLVKYIKLNGLHC